MKKLLAMLLALTLMFAFTACGKDTQVKVKSLSQDAAFSEYAVTPYTEIGYKMNLKTEYDGKVSDIKYACVNPTNEQKLQFSYDASDIRAAFILETLEGASLDLFYLDNGSEKTATESHAKDDMVKAYAITGAVLNSGFEKENIKMELKSANSGTMTFTAKGASEDLLKLTPGVEKSDAVKEELENVEYVYEVENSLLKSVKISGVIGDKKVKAEATGFEVISNKKENLKFKDAGDFTQKITSNLEELAEQQEEAKAAAEEAATSEGAAGSGASATTTEE